MAEHTFFLIFIIIYSIIVNYLWLVNNIDYQQCIKTCIRIILAYVLFTIIDYVLYLMKYSLRVIFSCVNLLTNI